MGGSLEKGCRKDWRMRSRRPGALELRGVGGFGGDVAVILPKQGAVADESANRTMGLIGWRSWIKPIAIKVVKE
jgi:hypothetical protein